MTSEKEAGYRWVILSIFVISQFFLSIAGFGWGSLAPFLKKVMALNSTQIGLISSSFYFTSSMSAFPAGIAIDRYGVKAGVIVWLGLTGLPLFFLSFIHYYYLFLVVLQIHHQVLVSVHHLFLAVEEPFLFLFLLLLFWKFFS